MNNVQLIGRLTKEINLHQSQSGSSVGTFTIAVDRQFKRDGQPDADFINCVMFKAERVGQYLTKGKQVGIDGRIQTRNYEKDGQRVYVTEVIVNHLELLGGNNNGNKRQNNNQSNYNQQATNNLYGGNNAPQGNPFNNASSNIDVSDSDLPF